MNPGIGSLAPADGHLPLWALVLASIAVIGVAGGSFVLVRYRRE